MVLLRLWIERGTVQPVVHVHDAAERFFRIFLIILGFAEDVLGEIVVAQRSEVLAAVVVVILDDLRPLLDNVPFLLPGLLPGTLFRRERLGHISRSSPPRLGARRRVIHRRLCLHLDSRTPYFGLGSSLRL